ncbi:response regulator transcription factor [Streptomyces sp. HUAS TT7]|uniref:response regulator transcription factor n=1 Tax=Streptomyces sp. HUAS TT7 TaxID=3447507 RepID=UPI003F65D263
MRVIIADDAPLLRDTYRAGLSALDVEVVAEAATADEIPVQVRRHHPDAVLLDISFGGFRGHGQDEAGLQAAEDLRTHYPHLGIVIFSVYMTPAYLERVSAIGNGKYIGYMGKDRISDLGTVVEALTRVTAGEAYYDPALTREMLNTRRVRSPVRSLSTRQRQALELLAQGHSNQSIAREMGVAVPTVEATLNAVFKRLGIAESPDIHKRVTAVLAWWRSCGSLPPDQP